MDYAKISQQALKIAAKYIRAELKKDAANRYSLKIEWWLPALRGGLPAGEYAGEYVNIYSDGKYTLVWYNPFESTPERPVCDGASHFPDRLLGINLIPGSIAHDVIYRELEKIAQAFGVSVAVVRKFADQVFKSVNLAENEGKVGAETISTLTFWGVRLFGGIYHKRHIATTVLVMLMLSGCAGCVASDFDDPGSYESPQYEKVD